MRISTKGRYGLRVMLELGCYEGSQPLTLETISDSQNISRKYLHSVLTSLKAAGLVRSVRGAGGGFVLTKLPRDISVSEIVLALEGPFCPVQCVTDRTLCKRSDHCVANEVWQALFHAMQDALAKFNLETLVKRQKSFDAKNIMYYI